MEDAPMSQDSSDIYFNTTETLTHNHDEINSSASETEESDGGMDLDQSTDDEMGEDGEVNEIVVDLTDEKEGNIDMVGNLDGDDDIGKEENVGSKLPAKMLKPRNYQLEMLEESLRRNIIVAMDTGSGKTQIAVLRIKAELERTPSDKLVWFMAPTVALCEQQYHVLEEQVPAVKIKFLSGLDNVDRWTTQELWDAVLQNVRVVASTPQILLDALTHAFVKLSKISLLVFDEAHNSVKQNPGSQIMRDFYHMAKLRYEEVPHILGLSASPIMNSDPQSLSKIEETLDAICRTPNKHRAELLQQVKLPELKRTFYSPHLPEDLKHATAVLSGLHKTYEALDIREDPYVLKLKSENTEKSLRKLEKTFKNRKTYCQEQFKSLCLTSRVICEELGEWAADFYVSSAIARFTDLAQLTASFLEGYDVEEKVYLAKALRNVDISSVSMSLSSASLVSDKVCQFIKTLLELHHPGILGIVFVRQRATVAVLAHLLSIHPETKDLFKIGTFVGISQDPRRITNVADMLDVKHQDKALEDFRSGAINLIISTSALEEGIDVPACNTVLCFNSPDNLKVLVQRRGRARSRESKLILMVDRDDDKVEKWLEFEKHMKQVYADDMRKLREIETLENLYEPGHREFRVESTGALLNLNNAVQHLYHFCDTLPADQYIDLRPEFRTTEVGNYLQARVNLPLCVDEKYRYAEGQQAWPAESDAIRDASFEACLMLYRGGLINEHLLPLLKHRPIAEDSNGKIEKRSAQMLVSTQINPWVAIAQSWVEQTQLVFHQYAVRVESETGTLSEMKMILPDRIPDIAPITIYWDAMATLRVTVSPVPAENPIQAGDIATGRMETNAILKAAYGHWNRFPCDRSDYAAIFMANSPETSALRIPPQKTASEFSFLRIRDNDLLVIRDSLSKNRPYFYEKLLASKPPDIAIRRLHWQRGSFEQDVPYLSLTKISKRADFLHIVPPNNKVRTSNKLFDYVLPASVCMVDELPFELLQFALLMPSILHRIQVNMVADSLATSLLRDVQFSSLELIMTAISAPGAREEENYERLEFLGDSVLKICTTVQMLKDHPTWHEGYLSGQKDRFVCNARLSRAAVESGLDKFILTKPFTGSKWSPTYVSDLLEVQEDNTRKMSTKMLADVVEALIGAAMVDGGISKAVKCLRIFVPELEWMPIDTNRDELFRSAPSGTALLSTLMPLENLIGYHFQKKALLIEAMTHVSFTMAKSSLERLEFLGDSILDTIIVDKIFNHNKQLPVHKMHLLRTALVNADFLAFMCMELAIDQEKFEVVENGSTKMPEPVKSQFSLPLWSFMRHNAPPIAKAQLVMKERHHIARDAINKAFASDDHYPWIQLQRLHAPKFFSDIVESLLGAVWIDSGSLEVCEAILERMRILPYLRRIVEDDVHLLHPKEELGQLAVTEKVKYEIRLEKRKRGDDLDPTYCCEVFVGERMVGRSVGESDKELLKGCAAEAAVCLLKEERRNQEVRARGGV